MDYDSGFFMQKKADWSLLNYGMTIPLSVVIVLLHKLGIPIFVPTNDTLDIHKIHFTDRIIDKDEIEGIEFQIIKALR